MLAVLARPLEGGLRFQGGGGQMPPAPHKRMMHDA